MLKEGKPVRPGRSERERTTQFCSNRPGMVRKQQRDNERGLPGKQDSLRDPSCGARGDLCLPSKEDQFFTVISYSHDVFVLPQDSRDARACRWVQKSDAGVSLRYGVSEEQQTRSAKACVKMQPLWEANADRTPFLLSLLSVEGEGMMEEKAENHLPLIVALPHQESDFAFFTKHALCGSFLRFQSAHHFADFLSPKRPEAPMMRFKGRIPGEATRKFSGVLAMVPRTGYCQGRQTWKAD